MVQYSFTDYSKFEVKSFAGKSTEKKNVSGYFTYGSKYYMVLHKVGESDTTFWLLN